MSHPGRSPPPTRRIPLPNPSLHIDLSHNTNPSASSSSSASTPLRPHSPKSPTATEAGYRYSHPHTPSATSPLHEYEFKYDNDGSRSPPLLSAPPTTYFEPSPGGLRGIGKAIAGRMVRTARRGNLPFLVVFVTCVIFFFTALAGIGYVDPDSLSTTTEVPEFQPGTPVFDGGEAQVRMAAELRMEEQKALEKEWARKKRPQDGAWMRAQRDDRAVRRVPGAHAALASAVASASASTSSSPSPSITLDDALGEELENE